MIKVIVIFLLVLSVIVLVHELAHFLVAIWCKVRVTEFGLGFPPRLMKLFKWRKTQFSLNWLPIGGFVSLAGESELPGSERSEIAAADFSEENDKKIKSRAAAPDRAEKVEKIPKHELFNHKKAWQRALIIVAGPLANIFLGVILFAIVFCVMGIPVARPGASIGYVQPGSPAAEAGLEVGMQIMAMREASQAAETQTLATNSASVIDFTAARRGRAVTFLISQIPQDATCFTPENCEHSAENREITVYVRRADEVAPGEGAMGIAFEDYTFVFHPWYKQIPLGIVEGFKQSWEMAVLIIESLGKMLAQLFVRQDQANQLDVVGPVGMVNQIRQNGIFEGGFLNIVQFAAILSVNLGVMNLLPFPALDGGKLVMIGAGKIFGQKKVAKIEGYLDGIGFFLLILLMLIVTARDVFSIIAK